jgi:hypothetical protein
LRAWQTSLVVVGNVSQGRASGGPDAAADPENCLLSGEQASGRAQRCGLPAQVHVTAANQELPASHIPMLRIFSYKVNRKTRNINAILETTTLDDLTATGLPHQLGPDSRGGRNLSQA